MSRILTKFFGECDCADGDLYSFPSGLPGFEEQRSFFFLKIPGAEPLLFLQSASTRNLCFILLPILVVDPGYRLELAPEDFSELQLPSDRRPVIGQDVLCGAMVCSGDGAAPTANLMAPVVVNLRANIGMQVIHGETGYSHRHPLRFGETRLPC
jgi:flagellar assembly factor FliW